MFSNTLAASMYPSLLKELAIHMSNLKRDQAELKFDLNTIRSELREEGTYQRGGHAARTLATTSDLRLVLVAIRAGTHIARHHTNETISIQALTGHLHVHLSTTVAELASGQVLILEAGLEHDVVAVVDSTFLLTLGWGNRSA